MSELTLFQTWYGRDEPPPKVEKLKAGRFEVEFQNGDLRYVRDGKQELVRRVHVAIRDVNWDTIPAQINDLVVDAGEDRFRITYQAFHDDGRLRYRWRAILEGKPDGSIECSMDGAAESDFRYCRIGFCLLQPIEGFAGRPYRAATPSGPVSGVLPVQVEPQRIENGFEVPMFPSCSHLSIDLENGVALNMAFEGDLFEMEDQRNWTDGSFKTYCTPISLGYPHQAKSGQAFHQKITITPRLADALEQPSAAGAAPAAPAAPSKISLRLGSATGATLPKLGFGLPAGTLPPEQAQIELLSRLRPNHLKVELHLKDPDWRVVLDNALVLSRQLGSQLELTLFLPDDAWETLALLKERLRNALVAHVLVFSEAEAANGVTRPIWINRTKQALAPVLPGVRFCGGTNGNFAELNRQRQDIAAMDGVCFPLNPQVHTFDERALVEALEAQRDTIQTARSFCGNLPVIVSSVTLKPPFNVAATEAMRPDEPQTLPSSVDPRQVSLFGAAWTAGSICSLAAGGADSVTYYEITGRRGLMDTAEGSGLPGKFPSFPGMVYPLYWVFAFLSEARGAQLLALEPDQPLLVNGMVLQKESRYWLLVSNYQPAGRDARLCGVPAGQATCLRLNQDTAWIAATDPDAFRAMRRALQVDQGQIDLNLQPYETVLVEIQQ